MEAYTLLCAACYAAGIGAIAASFYVQRLEDKNRPAGHHLKATLERIVEVGEGRRLDFAFFLNGKPITCTAQATREESAAARLGRDYLIVYDEATGACVFNPCQRYRVWQAVLIIGGFFLAMFAVYLTIGGFGFGASA